MTADFFAFGINHEAARVSVREPFEFTEEQHRELVDRLKDHISSEWMLIATCNRTEVYGHGSESDAGAIRDSMVELSGTPWPEVFSFERRGEAAIHHVVEVTAGIRSQVLGDSQILNQVKQAYQTAHEYGTLGTALHRLLHTALSTSKRVARETNVSVGNPSIAALATRVARRKVAEVRKASIDQPAHALILGAGEMGTQLAKILHYDPAVVVSVASRSRSRVLLLEQHFSVRPVTWEERLPASVDADVVFVATSSRGYVLVADEMPQRNGRPVLIVDISVPRNVDPDIGQEHGYSVIDIDGLEEMDREQKAAQEQGLAAARRICMAAAQSVATWQCEQELMQPAVEALAAAFEAVREQEVTRNIHRFEPGDREQVDILTRSIMQKLLAIPLVKLKSSAGREQDLQLQVATLASLFARDACEE